MNDKLIIVLVGLPARGKSYTSNNLCRFLNWCGKKCKVFNAGEYRRKKINGYQNADFFDPNNKDAYALKEKIASDCFRDLLKWINHDGEIALFDATNTNKKRRQYLVEESKDLNIIFLELITNSQKIITNNLEMKLISPDYINKDKSFAINDFKKRHKFYEKIYEEIDDDEKLKYIKIIDFTKKMLITNIIGVNATLSLSYLINLRQNKYPIYLTRHGESINNILSIIGGDCDLSENGYIYQKKLHKYITNDIKDDFIVFTSCLKRTKITAKLFTEKK